MYNYFDLKAKRLIFVTFVTYRNDQGKKPSRRHRRPDTDMESKWNMCTFYIAKYPVDLHIPIVFHYQWMFRPYRSCLLNTSFVYEIQELLCDPHDGWWLTSPRVTTGGYNNLNNGIAQCAWMHNKWRTSYVMRHTMVMHSSYILWRCWGPQAKNRSKWCKYSL